MNLFLAQLNFLEVIGALTLVFGAFYLWLTDSDKRDKEIKFYNFILEKDSKVMREFEEFCKENKVGGNSALRQFFTDEKLKEINERWED